MDIETENRYIENLKAKMEGCISSSRVVDELWEKTFRNDSKACLDLGYILFYGIGGIEEDKRDGLWAFIRAFLCGNKDGLDALENMVERGKPEALFVLGRMYYLGLGFEKDIRKAAECYERGAKLGDAACLEQVGDCYLKGKGVEKDVSKAIEYYKKATEYGSTSAMERLAMLYSEGEEVEKDDGMVFELWKEYYEMRPNYYIAVWRLANCYDKGIGTQKDEKKAFEVVKESAEKGNRFAYYSLASRYEEGKGTEVDIKEAYKWYLKSYEESAHTDLEDLIKIISILEENPGLEKNEDMLKEYKKEREALEAECDQE